MAKKKKEKKLLSSRTDIVRKMIKLRTEFIILKDKGFVDENLQELYNYFYRIRMIYMYTTSISNNDRILIYKDLLKTILPLRKMISSKTSTSYKKVEKILIDIEEKCKERLRHFTILKNTRKVTGGYMQYVPLEEGEYNHRVKELTK